MVWQCQSVAGKNEDAALPAQSEECLSVAGKNEDAALAAQSAVSEDAALPVQSRGHTRFDWHLELGALPPLAVAAQTGIKPWKHSPGCGWLLARRPRGRHFSSYGIQPFLLSDLARKTLAKGLMTGTFQAQQ
eukprot:1152834-Pelagomonas_calceolata.AAC.4